MSLHTHNAASHAFSHTLTTLDNGLQLLRIPMPAVKSVTVLMLANTGSRYERPKQQGIAHFFEHMVFKGSKNFPTAQILAATVDGVGADFNAFTGKEYTGYYVKAASRHAALALDVVSDMLLTPRLRQQDIDREKGVIIEEIHMYEDNPSHHIANLFEQLTFRGNGLEHDIIGTPETVSQLTTADFRAFLSEWYGLANMVLVLAGDAAVVNDKSLLDKAAGLRAPERVDRKVPVRRELTVDPLAATTKTTANRLLIKNRPTEQAHLVMAWPGLNRRDPDRYALSLLSTILGGNMSSRLFTEVREQRGLCYYVNSDVDVFHDTGLFGASAGVDVKRVEEALTVIIDQFNQVAAGKQPLTEGELSRAKEYLAGKTALSYESSYSMAQYFGMRQLLQDEIETPEQMLAKIRAVELPELAELAQRLVRPGELRLAVIGAFPDAKKFERFVK